MTLAIDFAGFHVITGKHKEIKKKWLTNASHDLKGNFNDGTMQRQQIA